MNIEEHTPRTLQQLITTLGEQMQQKIPELAGLVRVTGQMTNPGAARGNWHYGVRIMGDTGAQVKADLPASLVTKIGAAAGSPVRITGTLRLDAGNYGLEARLIAGNLELVGDAKTVVPEAGRASIDLLKALPTNRYSFPPIKDLSISLIQSSSANALVAGDCQSELDRLGDAVRVEQIRVNVLDPVAVARAIDQASGRIVMLIRGGGDAADFEVFDHPRVLQALATKQAYRVVGLGHTGNATILDFVADFSANTPAQAGQHVREQVENRFRYHASVQDRIKTLEQERDQAIRRGPAAANGVPWWWIGAALVAGLVIGWLLK